MRQRLRKKERRDWLGQGDHVAAYFCWPKPAPVNLSVCSTPGKHREQFFFNDPPKH
jgi:hypothetical protein